MSDEHPEKIDIKDTKKKRDEYTVEIRKKKREDIITKRRNRNLEIDAKLQEGNILSNNHNLGQDSELKKAIDVWLKRPFDMAEFVKLVEAANSEDKFQQHYGVIGLRKILSNENGPPIQPVIDANMVPRLIYFMQKDDEPHLQLEAAWALTNVASGSSQQTQSIIDKGGIPCFIKLVKTDRLEVAEQAIWALGNIAGDSANFRDMILKYGGLEPLLTIVNTTSNRAIIKHGTWAVSNLCRGKPLPELRLVEKALPTLCQVIKAEIDIEILTDSAWALSYMSRTEIKANEVIQTGAVPYLVEKLGHPSLPLVIPCLRTLGNIVTGSDALTSAALDCPEFLPKLFQLIKHQKKAVRREVCWTLSNITAGNANQIEHVMGNLEYMNILIRLAEDDVHEVKREASWVLSNATKHSEPEQIMKMVQMGMLDCFISLLSCDDAKSIEIVLEGINNILNWGAIIANKDQTSDNIFLVHLESKGAVKKIEDLQKHPNNEVYNKALKILETHFELDDVF